MVEDKSLVYNTHNYSETELRTELYDDLVEKGLVGITSSAVSNEDSFSVSIKSLSDEDLISKITLMKEKLNRILAEQNRIKSIIDARKNNKSKQKSSKKSAFKNLYICILTFGLPPHKMEDVEAHMDDNFSVWKEKYGSRFAQLLRAWHMFWIVVAHHKASITKILTSAVGLDIIKHFFGR